MIALAIVGSVMTLAVVGPLFRLSPWVYRTSHGDHFARVGGQRCWRGRYLLWVPVRRLLPGLWIRWGQEFYLDDYDFTRLWAGRP